MKSIVALRQREPELADAFVDASNEIRRVAALTACEIVTKVNGLDKEPVVARAIESLRMTSALDDKSAEALAKLVVNLDEEYFKLDKSRSAAKKALSREWFRKARAAAALDFAIRSSPEELDETIYEALFAFVDKRSVRSFVPKIVEVLTRGR